MSEKSPPKTGAERQRELRSRRLKAGMDQFRVWVQASTIKRFNEYQRQHGLDHDAAMTRLLDNAEQERK